MRHRWLVLPATLLAGGVLLAPGALGAKQLPSLGKHVCTVIGGVWTQKKSTCEFSSSRTVTSSFVLGNGRTLLIDRGVTLTIGPTTQIVDLSGAQGGIVNNGMLDNVGTIANDGTADGAVLNTSSGTFHNSGSILFASRNDGQVTSQGTFDNSGSLQSWNLTVGGALTNTGNLTVDQALRVTAGGVLDNSGLISAQWSTSIDEGGAITNRMTGRFTSLSGATTSFDNHGSLDNFGQLTNRGLFVNETDGNVANEVGASVGNYGSIDNFGTVTNGGAIDDWCGAAFTNETGSGFSGDPVTNLC